MEGLEAIDEQLEALAAGTDVEGIIAKAHDELPDHSESFEAIDAMIENLGEAVALPTVEPVGIDIPKPELPEIPSVPEPDLAEVPDTAVHAAPEEASAAPEEASAAPEEASAALEEAIPPTREHESPPEAGPSAVATAAAADAAVDELTAEGEGGLDADALFGDLDPDSQLIPTEEVAEAAPAEEVAIEVDAAPAERPRTEPPPPPAEADGRDSIEELDLDDILIEEDDSFELMIDEDDEETTVHDAALVEQALAEGAESEGEGEGEDDPREQSFFKKIFG